MAGYPADLTLKVKLLPHNLKGTFSIASAVEMSIATTSRSLKPLPPGDVRINGLPYSLWPDTTVGDVILSWQHRNRAQQGVGELLVPQDATGGYTLEGTITVEVLLGGVVKRTWAGLTGTSLTYTLTQRTADDADVSKTVAFRITPINGAFSGTQRVTPAFMMA